MLHSAEQSNIKVNNDAAQAATLLLESFISECIKEALNKYSLLEFNLIIFLISVILI